MIKSNCTEREKRKGQGTSTLTYRPSLGRALYSGGTIAIFYVPGCIGLYRMLTSGKAEPIFPLFLLATLITLFTVLYIHLALSLRFASITTYSDRWDVTNWYGRKRTYYLNDFIDVHAIGEDAGFCTRKVSTYSSGSFHISSLFSEGKELGGIAIRAIVARKSSEPPVQSTDEPAIDIGAVHKEYRCESASFFGLVVAFVIANGMALNILWLVFSGRNQDPWNTVLTTLAVLSLLLGSGFALISNYRNVSVTVYDKYWIVSTWNGSRTTYYTKDFFEVSSGESSTTIMTTDGSGFKLLIYLRKQSELIDLAAAIIKNNRSTQQTQSP